MYGRRAQLRAQAVGHQEVVDAPPRVLLARTEAVGPPRVHARRVGVEVAEGVGEACGEQLAELLPLLVGEARVAPVGLGVLQVNLLVGHVHVAADDDGLPRVEFLQIAAELVFPLHAVVQPPQFVLRVGRVDIHQVERGHLQRDDTPLAVVLLAAYAVADTDGLVTGVDGRARVALLLGVVPVRRVAFEGQIDLPGLHLGLLQAEEVGIQAVEDVGKAFVYAGPQAVDVPRYELHSCQVLSVENWKLQT